MKVIDSPTNVLVNPHPHNIIVMIPKRNPTNAASGEMQSQNAKPSIGTIEHEIIFDTKNRDKTEN